MDANYQKIKQMRLQMKNSMHLKSYPIKWEIDTAKSPNFHFWVLKQGIKSEVTTGNRLFTTGLDPSKDIRILKNTSP
jgi:hypothetical protein